MGIYYEWSDYQKGLSGERLGQIFFDKGMIIKEEITDRERIMDVIAKIKEVKHWAVENLDGLWASVFIPNTPNEILIFYFEKEEDVVAFKLRWL